MKNITKVILGLLVIGTAIGFSAFTNAKKNQENMVNKKSYILIDYLVQRHAGQFTPYLPYNEQPNGALCIGSSKRQCIYEVTLLGKWNIPNLSTIWQTYYTTEQIDEYLANNWLFSDPHYKYGLYLGDE
ncbi:hypothetical protein [Pedobacter gandavensis]|uniref:hypothetical protein n=1 Tax=Pedobacter gandavensis TaxID=2679963 RepID=UPI00292CC22A|nr:hypothetical protein [Pedobacter gandavensis]